MTQYEQHQERLDGAFLEPRRKKEVDCLGCWLWNIWEGSLSFFWRHLAWDKKIILHSERPSGSRKRCSETDCLDPYVEIDSWQVSQWLPRHCRCLCAHVSLCVERSVLVCVDNAACVWVWGISCLRVRWEGGWAILCMSDTPLYTHPSCTLLQALHFTPRQKKQKTKRSFYTSNLNILCRAKSLCQHWSFYSSWYVTLFAPACRMRWRRFYSSQPHSNCGAMLNVDLFLTQNNATLWECGVKPVSVTASVCETVKQVGGLRGCLISPSTRNKPNILSRWRIVLVQYFGWWLALYDIFIFRLRYWGISF